jgi:predicted ATPase
LPLTPLLGRSGILAAPEALLHGSQTRLVTLTGPGGVGKTRLAVAAATNLLGRYQDGVAFVPLAAVTDPNLVCVSIARLIGMRNMGSASRSTG